MLKVGDKMFRVYTWTQDPTKAIAEVEVVDETRQYICFINERRELERFRKTVVGSSSFLLVPTRAEAIQLLLNDAQEWLKRHESCVADSVKRIGFLRLQLAEEAAAQIEAELEAEQAAAR
jgi:hypothetical protein